VSGGSNGYTACVACVADELTSSAERISENEMARARRGLKDLDSAQTDTLARMARNLALRIVANPIRRLRDAPYGSRRMILAKTREIFDLPGPSACPLNRVLDDEAAPDHASPHLCPRELIPEDI